MRARPAGRPSISTSTRLTVAAGQTTQPDTRSARERTASPGSGWSTRPVGQRQSRYVAREPELTRPGNGRAQGAQGLAQLGPGHQVAQQRVVLVTERAGLGGRGREQLVAGHRVVGAVQRHPAIVVEVAGRLSVPGRRPRRPAADLARRGECAPGRGAQARPQALGTAPDQRVDRPAGGGQGRGAPRGGQRLGGQAAVVVDPHGHAAGLAPQSPELPDDVALGAASH